MEPGEPGAGGLGSQAGRGALAGWLEPGGQLAGCLAGCLAGAKEPARALGPEIKKQKNKKRRAGPFFCFLFWRGGRARAPKIKKRKAQTHDLFFIFVCF